MHTSGTIFSNERTYHPAVVGDLTSLIGLRHANSRTTRQKTPAARSSPSRMTLLGMGLVALAIGGLIGPLTPRIQLETKYALLQAERTLPIYQRMLSARITSATAGIAHLLNPRRIHPAIAPSDAPVAPAVADPLRTIDGASIEPVNRDFSLVIPKIGVNAAVLPAVNPTKPGEYLKALETGIAHSSLSYFPDEDGLVYLFSHSTNYEWFVGDLNAVFYLLKNLEKDDMVVLFYKGSSYTYKITGKQVVKPTAVSYMAPQAGARKLILQTCWPPGSTTERLLIFADLVEESNKTI